MIAFWERFTVRSVNAPRVGVPGLIVRRLKSETDLYCVVAACTYRMTVLPTVLRVTVRPFAVAMRWSVITTDHAPRDFETGGVKVMVALSIVVTTGAGRVEIEFKVAWALLINPTSTEANKIAMRKSAITLIFIR